MNCPSCGTEVPLDTNTAANTPEPEPEERRFCIFCGKQIALVARFCSRCGERQV